MKKATTARTRKPAAKTAAKPATPPIVPVPAEDPEITKLRLANEALQKDAEAAKAKAEAAKKEAKEAKAKAEAEKVKANATSKSKAKIVTESPITWVLLVILLAVGYIFFVSDKFPSKVADPVETASAADQENTLLRHEIEVRDQKEAKEAKAKAEADEAREAKFREELAEANRDAEAREAKFREDMLAAIAAIKVEAPAPAPSPAGSSEIEKLSPEKTAALLGTPGQGFKDPGHEGGPLVFSLSEITGTGGERIFLPNVNEGRSVSGAPGENIPAPQMKCAMPPGVAQLRWVQTSSPDPKKLGHFFYGLAPY